MALTRGGLLPADLLTELRSVQAYGRDMVVGEQARWGLGVGIDDDGWGMGGLGGNLGWFSEHGQYDFAFVTGQLGDFQRATAVENALRAVLDLPPGDNHEGAQLLCARATGDPGAARQSR